jgi:hypothetical protein
MSEEAQQPEVVADRGGWQWSELYRKEDWWAIWLGFAILALGLVIFLPRPPSDMEETAGRHGGHHGRGGGSSTLPDHRMAPSQ